jgi:integrase/recombinase XerD
MAARKSASDAQLIALILDMLAAEQGAGENTTAAYRRDLEDLSAFLAGKGSAFARASTNDVRGYLADLDERGFKSTSVARKLSALRHLFRFMVAENFRSDDPAAVLSGPKRGRALPKVLSIADVDRLLAQAKSAATTPELTDSQRVRALRLACLLEVLYATGLRVSELVTCRCRRRGATRG